MFAIPHVNRGRWLIRCPFLTCDCGCGAKCGGAEEALRCGDWWLCRACLNAPVCGEKVPIVWPSHADIRAIEAALAVRPVLHQNWEPDETIGALLFENVDHGLFDRVTGAITGDIGADQMRAPALLALAGLPLSLGAG